MTLRTIPRAVVGGYVAVLRFPADQALRVAGERGANSALKLALDRSEAAFRALAGTVLNDETLKDDARRRSHAASERGRALRLRREAARRSEHADERVAERQQAADRKRTQAKSSAADQRQRAKRQREATEKQAGQTAARRRQAAEKSAARSAQAIEERAKPARLEHLETKSEALEQREAALDAADETRRLAAAAAKAKAERKNGRERAERNTR